MNRPEVQHDRSKNEITKKAFVNWGGGYRWQVDPIELKLKSQKTLLSNSIGSNRFAVGELSKFAWHLPTASTSPRQSIAVWALSTIPNEAIDRESQRVATGATAAPTDTDRSIAYPGGGSSKKIMAVASTIFPPARSAKRDENQAIDPKYRGKAQDFESCIAVAVPCVAFKGFHRPLERG